MAKCPTHNRGHEPLTTHTYTHPIVRSESLMMQKSHKGIGLPLNKNILQSYAELSDMGAFYHCHNKYINDLWKEIIYLLWQSIWLLRQ